MRDVLEELDIPDVKAYRVRLDQYIQEILGTTDLDPDRVWIILQPILRDPASRELFVRQLRAKWENRDWHNEGL